MKERVLQPLHRIISYASPGAIRTAAVFLDLDCNLFRVSYNSGESFESFPTQEQAVKSAQDFIA